ncbi:MAG: molybdopterin-dependent oxidoreductase [Sphingomonas sp.]|jgi:DMSO/TMAO reductase YedYZ molybdopterin-dependent catalytic subunit|uniref:molybdopterin-dependent oxidoreductase n=1 Tax=Sphingomonas sp. TaxID=28214 RepID=UPI00356715F8
MITRRSLIGSLGASAGGLLLSGCDRIAATPAARSFFEGTEGLTRDVSRLTGSRHALAQEFSDAQISATFRSNGTSRPGNADYAELAANGFRDYRLRVDGLVRRPLTLSMDQIHRLPRRTQTTRHDCVEGWSAIGKWTGTPLGGLLRDAGLMPAARYVVFHCADDYGSSKYYESIDLLDAFHPQTIMAWGLNGHALPIANGAPLRLRVERQLGYKHAKYVMRIEVVDSLLRIGAGKGGYWEDSNDYAWFAGI